MIKRGAFRRRTAIPMSELALGFLLVVTTVCIIIGMLTIAGYQIVQLAGLL